MGRDMSRRTDFATSPVLVIPGLVLDTITHFPLHLGSCFRRCRQNQGFSDNDPFRAEIAYSRVTVSQPYLPITSKSESCHVRSKRSLGVSNG